MRSEVRLIRGLPNGVHHARAQPCRPGRPGPERLVVIDWKRWSSSTGFTGRHAPARAVQIKAERAKDDALQHSHSAISLLKRWLFGTHGSAVSMKYMQPYLDEYVFRYNRRKTKGVGRIAARIIAQLVAHGPWTMRQIINETVPFRMFPDKAPELTA